MKYVLLAGLGGFIGSAARYLVGITLPFATLFVNVTGSFLIGFLAAHGQLRGWMDDGARIFILVGILGGFTTFSSFSYETMSLWRDGSPTRALMNVLLSVVLCLLAVWCGDALARATAS